MQTRTCACGYEETMPVSATGEHSYGEWVTTVEATCATDGTKIHTCHCGAEETMIICATGDHLYGNWITTIEATCVTDGTETRTCACGAEETAMIIATGKHVYGNWVTTTAATCTAEGVQTRTCSCGAKETRAISATEHSYGAWLATTAATCTSEGEQTRTCSCGAKETKPIRRLVHKWKEATCMEPKTCTRCHATVGSVLDHSLNCNGYCTMCGKRLAVDMRDLVGRPSGIFYFYIFSEGKMQVQWTGENLSGKTITSYSVTIYFYNNNGAPAYNKNGKSGITLTYEVTVAPNGDLTVSNNIDSAPDCEKIVIGDIKLQFSDGTSISGWYGWGTGSPTIV